MSRGVLRKLAGATDRGVRSGCDMVDAPTVACPEAEGVCPPADAEPANCSAFRAVHNDPPTAKDVQTTVEEGKFRRGDRCQRCGVSVFRTERDLEHAQALFPRAMGRLVARAVLMPAHGFIKKTPSGANPEHHTWWPAAGVVREELFQVLQRSTRD
jgi:hypothetical protein